MCGITGQINLTNAPIQNLDRELRVMNKIIAHRGPDGEGFWRHKNSNVGFGHLRLSIIDLETGQQPITAPDGTTISFNGELYNYKELRPGLSGEYKFKTTSDTEVLLAGYLKWGPSVLDRLRGMYAFSIWDEQRSELFCARDRFGIKPFYYAQVGDRLLFASEAKALIPFLPSVETDTDGLEEYFTFQFCLNGTTLFKGIKQLPPGHFLQAGSGGVTISKYWEPDFNIDWNHTEKYFQDKTRALIEDSVTHHLISDVPVGAYLSGGVDSSLVAALANRSLKNEGQNYKFKAFTGKFSHGSEYDESPYARILAERNDIDLYELDITSRDFTDVISKVIYHLDYPVAGPGSFPQFLISKLASEHVKVCLGGQGGDEIFGGYVRYLLAYFEQCIKGAIDGTMNSGNFIVTYESIIPNLSSLRNYKPLMSEFWSSGLFDEREGRYFRLISRSESIRPVINVEVFRAEKVFGTFKEIFCGKNVEKASYFDSMTNFDFKTLLPALLQVEDRVSMAHGLESRVPLIDHPLMDFVSTIPSNVKFDGGRLKHLLREIFKDVVPTEILNRSDKMGFPVPLGDWLKRDINGFVLDIFGSQKAKERSYFRDNFKIESILSKEGKFDRNLWGLLSLELWQQQYHDQAHKFSSLLE